MDVANGNDGAAANGVCFPYDVLLNFLRRLPRRALARSRRVCRAWRAIVDAHALLVPHAFPRDEFPGVYANYFLSSPRSAFFAPPPPRSGVDPAARFRRPFAWNDLVLDPHVWRDWGYVQQHCNGLLLVRDRCKFEYVNHVHVCNPATMWRARLPSPPKPWPRDVQGMFLAFDPAVSRHHEVFMFPQNKLPSVDKNMAISLPVFSSRTGRWENRWFAPGRCAPVHLYDAGVTEAEPRGSANWIWSAEYWRGSLYVHVRSGVLVILRCSGNKYDMVELPNNDPPTNHDTEEQHEETPKPRKGSVLANYEGGVRYVMLNKYRLLVWVLSESTDGQLEWVFEREPDDLRPHYYAIKLLIQKSKPRMEIEWEIAETREERNNNGDMRVQDIDDLQVKEELGSREEGSEYSWNSDKHNFIQLLDESSVVADDLDTSELWCDIIGFHPHKNALLLHFMSAVVVYYLDSSTMQYLGQIYPLGETHRFDGVFPYRPCYFDMLPPN